MGFPLHLLDITVAGRNGDNHKRVKGKKKSPLNLLQDGFYKQDITARWSLYRISLLGCSNIPDSLLLVDCSSIPDITARWYLETNTTDIYTELLWWIRHPMYRTSLLNSSRIANYTDIPDFTAIDSSCILSFTAKTPYIHWISPLKSSCILDITAVKSQYTGLIY